MNPSTQPIGIIDSGIGGYTVAKAVQKLLPQEDLLYLGDGANAPYGNRTQEELIKLAKYTVSFMMDHQVKLLLVACNTISCLSAHYLDLISCPVLFVVESGARGAAQVKANKIGVISTNFTYQNQMYPRFIQKIAPDKEIFACGSTHLVKLIEENHQDQDSHDAICQELRHCLDPLVEKGIECCVLGCTHYPLVEKQLEMCYPQLTFCDPAQQMALEAQQLLNDNDLLNKLGGKLDVFTTGNPALQENHLKQVGLEPVNSLQFHPPLVL